LVLEETTKGQSIVLKHSTVQYSTVQHSEVELIGLGPYR
jgi:hypothetical protein